MARVPPKVRTWQCYKCNHVWTQPIKMKPARHQGLDIEIRPYRCPRCGAPDLTGSEPQESAGGQFDFSKSRRG
jgi:hypothetical protein